jgi:hypothetical protein
VLQIPGILFYTAADVKIDIEDFPKDKADFDVAFSTIVMEERNQRLVVGFKIRSDQSFHSIKKSVWPLLTNNNIFLKKHSGKLSTMDIVTIGHIHHAHLTFTNQANLHDRILTIIYNKLAAMLPSKCAIIQPAHETIPDIFLTTGCVNGTFQHDAIQSNIIYVQAERTRSAALKQTMEKCCEDKLMTYIPSSLKHEDPELFGNFLCHHNEFLENHRNVAITGISTKVMDHKEPFSTLSPEDDTTLGRFVWNHLRTLEGVDQIDACRHTYDLGKWNLSTTKGNYTAVTQWIDKNIGTIFAECPIELRNNSSCDAFPAPCHLTRTP